MSLAAKGSLSHERLGKDTGSVWRYLWYKQDCLGVSGREGVSVEIVKPFIDDRMGCQMKQRKDK